MIDEVLVAGDSHPLDRTWVAMAKAGRWLRHDRAAALAVMVLCLIVVACAIGAPLYAHFVAGRGPDDQGLSAYVVSNGRRVPVVATSGRPIGPGWYGGRYLLGADTLGRDALVRLLYGGRASLIVGSVSALLSVVVALVVALVGGFFGGAIEGLLRVVMEITWAFPVYLLAIALGAALAAGGLSLGFTEVRSGGLMMPILIIGFVLVPYVARPLLAEVLTQRRREFIEASIVEGQSAVSIIMRDLLPNVLPYAVVFAALLFANNMIVEAALSYLGIGVQAPTPSWGNMIQDGTQNIASAPWLTIAPGLALLSATFSANVLADRLRRVLGADVGNFRPGVKS